MVRSRPDSGQTTYTWLPRSAPTNATPRPPIAARRLPPCCPRRPPRSPRCLPSATRRASRWCRAAPAASLAGGALPTADCVLLATDSTGQFDFCRERVLGYPATERTRRIVMGRHVVDQWPDPPAAWSPELRRDFVAGVGSGVVGTRRCPRPTGCRVWHLCLGPGERIGLHRPRARLFLDGDDVGPRPDSRYDDGSTRERRATPPGTTAARCAMRRGQSMIHDRARTSATPNWGCATVEFLDSANAALAVPEDKRAAQQGGLASPRSIRGPHGDARARPDDPRRRKAQDRATACKRCWRRTR